MNDHIDFNNLKILENKSCIKVFKKNSSNSSLRDSCKIIDDCNKMKKKKLLDLSNNLKHLANSDINLNNIKILQEEFYNEINNIDHIMNIIYNYKPAEEHFIEIYGN